MEAGTASAVAFPAKKRTPAKKQTLVVKRSREEYSSDDTEASRPLCSRRLGPAPVDPRLAQTTSPTVKRADVAVEDGASFADAVVASVSAAGASVDTAVPDPKSGPLENYGNLVQELLDDGVTSIPSSFVPAQFCVDVGAIVREVHELHTAVEPFVARFDVLSGLVAEAISAEQEAFPGTPGKYTLVSLEESDVTDDQRASFARAYGFKGRWLDVYGRLRYARKAVASARESLNTSAYTLDYMQGEYEDFQSAGSGGLIAVLPKLRFGTV
jgi:hypothetical protein